MIKKRWISVRCGVIPCEIYSLPINYICPYKFVWCKYVITWFMYSQVIPASACFTVSLYITGGIRELTLTKKWSLFQRITQWLSTRTYSVFSLWKISNVRIRKGTDILHVCACQIRVFHLIAWVSFWFLLTAAQYQIFS